MAGKSDETEVCRRVEEVLHLILDGADHHAIVQHAAAKGWDVEERQLRTYASRAHDLLVDRQERSRKRTIARHVAQRERIFKKCVDAEDFKTALSVLTDLAKLRGLYPEKEAKELAKLALIQGMKIEELERRLRDATRATSPQVPESGSPVGCLGSSAPSDGGSVGDVEERPGPADE